MKSIFFALALAAGASAMAQNYPSKPVRIIEITIRAVADEMSKTLGQPLLIEARPSSSALVGPASKM